MAMEAEILSKFLPGLQTLLDVPRLSWFLQQQGLLTEDEYRDMLRIPRRSRAVERLVSLIQQRRGEQCARVLLAAVQAVTPHIYQYDTIRNLERDVRTLGSLGLPLSGSSAMLAVNPAKGGYTAAQADNATLRGSLSRRDLRKKERINSKLKKEMQKLQKHFKEFHLSVRKKLSCKGISFGNIQNSLQYHPCFKNATNPSHILGHNTAVGRAKNMCELFNALLSYTSWYNYQLVALLALDYGGKGGKTLVHSYEARLQDHLQRPVFHCPPFWPAAGAAAAGEDVEPLQEVPEGYIKMEVLVKRNYETTMLGDVVALKNALSELLQLHQEALMLGSVQPGEEGQCCMTWMIPSVAMQHVINIAIARMAQLGTRQVLQLRVGSTTVVTAPKPGQLASQPGSSCFSSGPQRSMSGDSTFTDDIGNTTASVKDKSQVDSHCQHKRATSNTQQRLVLDSGRGTVSPTTPQFSINSEAFSDVTGSPPLSGNCGASRDSGAFSPTLQQYYQQETSEYAIISHQKLHRNQPMAIQHQSKDQEAKPDRVPKVGSAATIGALIDPGVLKKGKVQRVPGVYHTWSRAENDSKGRSQVANHGEINTEAKELGVLGSVCTPVSMATSTLPLLKPHTVTPSKQQLKLATAKQLHVEPTTLELQPSEEADCRSHSSTLCPFPPPPLLTVSCQDQLRVTESSEGLPPSSPWFPSGIPIQDLQLSGPYDSLEPLEHQNIDGATLHRTRSESIFDEGTKSELSTPVHCAFIDRRQYDIKHHPQCDVPPTEAESPPQTPVPPIGAKSPPQTTVPPTGARSPPQTAVPPIGVKSPPQTAVPPTGAKSPQFDISPTRIKPAFQSADFPNEIKSFPQSSASLNGPKSLPQPVHARPTSFGISDVSKLLDSSNCQINTPSWETNHATSPVQLPFSVNNEHTNNNVKSQRDTSSFLWRVLTRASEQWPANIFVVTICPSRYENGDLRVVKGCKLVAMYKVGKQVYAMDCRGNKGFVPYSICRLSLTHYRYIKAQSLAHVNLYLQSADGVDNSRPHGQSLPVIRMVAIQDHRAEHRGVLSVAVGDKLRALYCDEQWVYAVNQTGHAGFLPRTACRLTRKGQEVFKDWIIPQRLFQSDFVVKYNEHVPDILMQRQAATMPVFKQGEFVIIEDSYISKESNVSEPVCLKKGLRVRLLEEKGDRLRVTTGPGVSCWLPAQYCTPCRNSRPSSVCSRSRSPGSRSCTASPFGSPLHATIPAPQQAPQLQSQRHTASVAHQRELPHRVTMDAAASRGSLHCMPMSAMTSRGSMRSGPLEAMTSRGSLCYVPTDAMASKGSVRCLPMDSKISSSMSGLAHQHNSKPTAVAPHRPQGFNCQQAKPSPDRIAELKPSASLKIPPPYLRKGPSPKPARRAQSPIPPVVGTAVCASNSRLCSIPSVTGMSSEAFNKRAVTSRNGMSSSQKSPSAVRRSGVSPEPYRSGMSPDPYSRGLSPLPQWTGTTPGVSPTHSGVYHHRELSNRRSWGAASSGSRGGISVGSRGDNSRHSPSHRSESFI